MESINIAAVPNQTIRLNVNQSTNLTITIRTQSNGFCTVDFLINAVPLRLAVPAFFNRSILREKFLRDKIGGDLMFYSVDQTELNYESFGTTQELIFFTTEDIENAQS